MTPVLFVCALLLFNQCQKTTFITKNKELLFVSNEDAGMVTIIDPNTLLILDTIPVGKRTRGMKVGPKGELLYVATSGSPKCPPWITEEECEKKKVDKSADGIAVIDIKKRKVIRVLPSGSDPEQFDISKDGNYIYISNEDVDMASVLDIKKGIIEKEIPVGAEPEGVRLSPDNKWCYVTAESDHTITVINTSSNKAVASINVGLRPRDIIFNASGSLAYVTGEADGSLSIIDTKSKKVIDHIKLREGSMPVGLVLSPDEKIIYIANGRGKGIIKLNLKTSKSEYLLIGKRPWGIVMSTNGEKIYLADAPSNAVFVVDVLTFKVQDSIKVAKGPWGLVLRN